MKKQYIQALIELIQSEIAIETTLTGLQKTMQEKGHMRLYPSVLRGALRVIETKPSPDALTVTVAKLTDIEAHKAVIQSALMALNAKDKYETKIDNTIIGGIIARSGNTVVDNSYKTALTKLYRATTN